MESYYARSFMKRIMILMTSAVLAFSLVACGNKDNRIDTEAVSASSDTPDSMEYRLDSNEESRVVTKDGNQIILMLRANPTTGYSWVADDSGSEMFRIDSDKYLEDEHDEDMAGVGGTETFIITVLQSGNGGLIFEYKQDWDGGESAGKYSLNVTASEEGGKPVVTDAEFILLDPENNRYSAADYAD